MSESVKTKLLRWRFNLFPAYRGTGGRITYISRDMREIGVKLPLNRRTRNYVGTIFGGSIYGAVDPIYMIMLIDILGPNYVVWDKSATIHFKKPGRATLYARFIIDDEELQHIRSVLDRQPSVDRIYRINLTDETGLTHATVEKTIYIRRIGVGD